MIAVLMCYVMLQLLLREGLDDSAEQEELPAPKKQLPARLKRIYRDKAC